MLNRAVRAYLVLTAAMMFFFAMQFAASSSPGAERDEWPHVSYAAAIAFGELPTIETPMPWASDGLPGGYLSNLPLPGSVHRTIWVANHPPGFYLLAAPTIWLSELVDNPGLGLFLLRMLNAAFTAGLVILAGLLARELLPRQPSAVLVAASVQAAMTALAFDAGSGVYNDGLGAFTCMLALLFAVRGIRTGITAQRVVAIAGLCAAAALSRSPGVLVTVLCAAAVAVAIRLDRSHIRWVRPAARSAALVAGVPALVAGWFYLRNWILYDSPTASQYLLDRFGRQPRPGFFDVDNVLSVLGKHWSWLFVERRLGGGASAPWNLAAWAVAGIAGLGLIVALTTSVVRAVVRRVGGSGHELSAGDRDRAVRAVAAWILMLVFSIITIALVMEFLAGGGGTHERYLLPVTPVLSVITAAGLLGLVAWLPRRLPGESVVAGLSLAWFTTWTVVLQDVTARWALHRNGNLLVGGPLGGFTLPVVFQVLGWLSAAGSLAIGIWLALRMARAAPAPPASAVATPPAVPVTRSATEVFEPVP